MYIYNYIYIFCEGATWNSSLVRQKTVFKIAVNVAHQEQKKTDKYQHDKIEQIKENKNRTSANKKEKDMNPH